MNENKRIEKLWADVEIAKRKDHIENEIDKKNFAKMVKNGIGQKMNDFNTYIKPEPSFFTRLKTKILRIFKYL